jgi:regulator of replication initiation timing
MTQPARVVDLEPIDRLEEKIKRLIGTLERVRAEHAKAVEETRRLTREIDAMRARLADAESVATEVASLREERDHIRGRVAEMLEQLEALSV